MAATFFIQNTETGEFIGMPPKYRKVREYPDAFKWPTSHEAWCVSAAELLGPEWEIKSTED